MSNVVNQEIVAARLTAAFPDAITAAAPTGITIRADRWFEVARYLKETPDLAFNYLNNLTSVDWPDRFEVVYHLSALARNGPPITFKVNADKATPRVPSLTPLYGGADFQEREVYDMMGIRFEGHPNLRRILLWEGFEGYPLRKDYKEPYWEADHKPFETRWDQGHHLLAEDRNPWHDNVIYPRNFDPTSYVPPTDLVRRMGRDEFATATALRTEPIIVNMGPQHPSTHGVFRMKVTLDGETILGVEPVMGYLHRNHDKIGERNTYLMNMPYTDRLDYLTAMSNNLAYCLGVEKLMGVKPPERAEYIRVIMAELTRIVSHFMGLGSIYSDLGAFFTPILYGLEERELILDLFEAVSGSRMMCNYIRFGGVARDLPEPFLPVVKELVENRLPRVIDEYETYLVHNEMFDARARGIGLLPGDIAINYSAAGPHLRASGVKYDLRKNDPYSIYDRFEFDVPVGTRGDIWDRFFVRIEEMRQSVKILQQAIKQIPPGDIMTGKKSHQIRVPKGEAYGRTENPKGELGFYLVSDGSLNPYRYHVRSPCFINLTTLEQMAVGHKVADLVGILGSVDIIMGEVDR